MHGLSARLPAYNDPIQDFEGSVIDACLALHGLSGLLVTSEATVSCYQIAALVESIALRLDVAFDQYEAEQSKQDKRLKENAIK